MKKTIILLLMLCMLLSLCACGGETGGPETAEPVDGGSGIGIDPTAAAEPEPEPEEPEVNYIEKEVTRLAYTVEVGVGGWQREKFGPLLHGGDKTTVFHYDEAGNLTGESVTLRGETYCGWVWNIQCGDAEGLEYDEAGNLVYATRKGQPLNSWGNREIMASLETTEYFHVENDVPYLMERYVDETGQLVSDTTYEYYEDGHLLAETTRTWLVGGPDGTFIQVEDEPLILRVEFEDDGHYNFCHQEYLFATNEEGGIGEVMAREYRWTFNEAGNPVTMEFVAGLSDTRPVEEIEVKAIASAELHYDEEGRVDSGTYFRHGELNYDGMEGVDPSTLEYAFTYDEEGRMILCEITWEAEELFIPIEYTYNEDGFISSALCEGEGTEFTWERGEDGTWKGTASNTDLNVFPEGTVLYVPGDTFDADGHLTCAYRYILQPSSFNLMPAYLKHQTYWNYETVIIREEIPD